MLPMPDERLAQIADAARVAFEQNDPDAIQAADVLDLVAEVKSYRRQARHHVALITDRNSTLELQRDIIARLRAQLGDVQPHGIRS